MALRGGTAEPITAGFTMFLADYSERRAALVRGAHQLSLTQPGTLAAGSLGVRALHESATAMHVAAVASLLGAALPLLVGASLPTASWIVLVLTIFSLRGLGWILGGLDPTRGTSPGQGRPSTSGLLSNPAWVIESVGATSRLRKIDRRATVS